MKRSPSRCRRVPSYQYLTSSKDLHTYRGIGRVHLMLAPTLLYPYYRSCPSKTSETPALSKRVQECFFRNICTSNSCNSFLLQHILQINQNVHVILVLVAQMARSLSEHECLITENISTEPSLKRTLICCTWSIPSPQHHDRINQPNFNVTGQAINSTNLSGNGAASIS